MTFRELPAGQKPKVSLSPIAEPKGLAGPEVSAIARQLIGNVEKVVVGKHEQIVLAIAVFLAEGHLLIEDVPGVAKTMLARAIAQSAGCTFKRIQCTPDLQPTDVLGEARLEPTTGRSEFRFGPIFSQFVLVDEINRASPRTQSALLQAMQEHRVSVAGQYQALPTPFHVLATQNPLEQEGTYPLPEAQLDRFLLQIDVGYPDIDAERKMLLATTGAATPTQRTACCRADFTATSAVAPVAQPSSTRSILCPANSRLLPR